MKVLAQAVRRLTKDLTDLDIEFALVGALALGTRGRVRQTIDADFAISVNPPGDSRLVVDSLFALGYGTSNVYENQQSEVVLAKLFAPDPDDDLIELDLLFKLCGIEEEVVKSAERLEVWPDIFIPVATLPSLIAMKARCQELPERIQDKADLVNHLLPVATKVDLAEARVLIQLIEKRGFNDGRNIIDAFDNLVKIHKILGV